MTTLTAQLLNLTDLFAAATKRSRARVSTLIFNDGKRLDRIAAGSDIGTRSYEAVIRWLSTNWPADLEWPAEVPRPSSEGGVA